MKMALFLACPNRKGDTMPRAKALLMHAGSAARNGEDTRDGFYQACGSLASSKGKLQNRRTQCKLLRSWKQTTKFGIWRPFRINRQHDYLDQPKERGWETDGWGCNGQTAKTV